MAKADKELERAKNNPRGWHFERLTALYEKYGFTIRSGKGSHFSASHPDIKTRPTFPRHGELPSVYVRQAVAAIEELLALKEEKDNLNKPLWEKAEHLASQAYDIEMFKDTLTNGDIVILAKNPELPGCMAHGATRDEAIANLKEARTEYIYSLLLDELPIPHPRGKTVSTVSQNVAVDNRVINGFGQKLDSVFEPDTREGDLSYRYRGDFVKQS